MSLIENAIQSLSAMTHTELMLTGIFACLLIQTLFQIAGRMTVKTQVGASEYQSASSSTGTVSAPIRNRTNS